MQENNRYREEEKEFNHPVQVVQAALFWED